jgi:hypothetical protein
MDNNHPAENTPLWFHVFPLEDGQDNEIKNQLIYEITSSLNSSICSVLNYLTYRIKINSEINHSD